MLAGLKNFAIQKVIAHLADDAQLNHTTNGLGIGAVLYALAQLHANWTLLLKGDPVVLTQLIGTAVSALLLFWVKRVPGLAKWLPTVDAIIVEAQKEVAQDAAAPKPNPVPAMTPATPPTLPVAAPTYTVINK